MATYVNDLRLKEIATGDESGTWGTSTNTNLELIAEAFSFGTEAITTNADTHTTTIADGSTDPGRSIYLKYTGTLDSACTITIGPNTVSKLWFIENGTSGSQNIIISQGSGANVTVPAGEVKAIYSDGAGSGAAMVDAFANLKVSDAAQTNITSLGTLTTLTVDDITIDGSTISDSGDLTLDVGGDIILDADGSTISMKDGGTNRITFNLDSTPDLVLAGGNASITASTSDADLLFIGNDGGSDVTALTLDMSQAGRATFNEGIVCKSSTGGDFGVNINTASGDSLKLQVVDTGTGGAANGVITVSDGDLILSPSANVGIGTTSPDAPLHINGSVNSEQVIITGNANANRGLSIQTAASGGQQDAGVVFDAQDTESGAAPYHAFKTAGTERMRITDSGRIGIGTNSPSQPIHVATSNSGGYLFMDDGANGGFQIKANTSEVIMEFITTGFGAFETADLRANFFVFRNSGTNEIAKINGDELSHTHVASNHTQGFDAINSQAGGFGSAITFISERSDNNALVDAARIRSEGASSWNSDSSTESALVFEVCNNNSLSEAMRIRNDGDVIIGGTTLAADGSLSISPNHDDGACSVFFDRASTTATSDVLRFENGGSTVSQVSYNNTTVTYGTGSDARYKNILGEAKGLEIVNKLNPVNFEWKDGGEIQDGLIAQEVEKLIPHAVVVNEEGYYSMDYSKVVTPLIKAIQEQQEQIDALQSEINILKGV